MRNIRPGCSRPLVTTLAGSMSITPTSRRHHDEVVVGDPVAARAQAVAVEHGADHRAVGERDAGRAVPRLHQRRVEAVERPLRRRPSRRGSPTPRGSSSAPRGGSGGRRGAAARAPRRSGPCRDAPGVQIGNARSRPGSSGAVEHRLAGAHPVLVALHRVDLAVVGDEAVRVGERPRRERVRREAAVHEQQRRSRSARRARSGKNSPSCGVVSIPL